VVTMPKKCECCTKRAPKGHVKITYFADEKSPIGFELCADCLGIIAEILKPCVAKEAGH